MSTQQRIERLCGLLPEKGADVLILERPIDILYLTGIPLTTGMLIADREKAFLIVDGRYFEQASTESPVPVRLLEKGVLQELFSEPFKGRRTLGFCADSTSFARYEELSGKIPRVALAPLQNPVEELRMIKDAEEIKTLRRAAALASQGYDFAKELLRPGITEKEVAAELEVFWLKNGGEGPSFEPIIAFGANTSKPHYHPGSTPLRKGDPVLFDIGVALAHYQSDMTRMAFFQGEPSKQMREIYEVVKEAQKRALGICRPGTKVGELDAAARDYITEKNYGEQFVHSLGHGIGLEVHEGPSLTFRSPWNEMELQAGMALTVEPGIYLPGVGGVRLENAVVVTGDGYEDLTLREC